MIGIRIQTLEEKVNSLRLKGMAVRAVGGEMSESLADHFITSRPLTDQQERRVLPAAGELHLPGLVGRWRTFGVH